MYLWRKTCKGKTPELEQVGEEAVFVLSAHFKSCKACLQINLYTGLQMDTVPEIIEIFQSSVVFHLFLGCLLFTPIRHLGFGFSGPICQLTHVHCKLFLEIFSLYVYLLWLHFAHLQPLFLYFMNHQKYPIPVIILRFQKCVNFPIFK